MFTANVIGQQSPLIATPGVLDRFTPLTITGTRVDGFQPPVEAADVSVAKAFSDTPQPGIVMMHSANPFGFAKASIGAALLAREARTDVGALEKLLKRAKLGDDFATAQLKRIDLSQLEMGFVQNGRRFICMEAKELVDATHYANPSAFVRYMHLAIEELELMMQGHQTLGALMHLDAFEGTAIMERLAVDGNVGKRDDYKELVKKNIGPIFVQAYAHKDLNVRSAAFRTLKVLHVHTQAEDFWRYAGVESNDIETFVQTAQDLGSVYAIRQLDVLHELNYADQFTTRSAIQDVDPMILIANTQRDLKANIDALDILIKHGNIKARNGLIKLLHTYEFVPEAQTRLNQSLLEAAKTPAFWVDLGNEIEAGSTAALAKHCWLMDNCKKILADATTANADALHSAITAAAERLRRIDAGELVKMIEADLHIMKDVRRGARGVSKLGELVLRYHNQSALSGIMGLAELLPASVSKALFNFASISSEKETIADVAYRKLLEMTSAEVREAADALYQIAEQASDEESSRSIIRDLSGLAVHSPNAARALMLLGGLGGGAFDDLLMEGLMKVQSNVMFRGLSRYVRYQVAGKCESCDDRVITRNDFMRKFLAKYEREVLGAAEAS